MAAWYSRSIPMSAALLICQSGGAFATGGLPCEASDTNMTFSPIGSLSRSLELRFLPVQASLVITVSGIDPELDVMKDDLPEKIAHSWITNDEIRFHIVASQPTAVLTT